MDKDYTIFDFLKGMTQNKEVLDFNDNSIQRNYSPFIVDKYVSMVNLFLPVANAMNKTRDLPKKMHYEFYKSVLPKKNIFFKYIKKKKEDDTAIDCIARYYEVSYREAKLYLSMFTKDQINQIVDKYNFGKSR